MHHVLKNLLPVAALAAVLSVTVAAQSGAARKGVPPQASETKPAVSHAPATTTMLAAEQTAVVKQDLLDVS